MYHNFPFQGLPKYIKVGIFGLKKYHLATLARDCIESVINMDGAFLRAQKGGFPRLILSPRKCRFTKNSSSILLPPIQSVAKVRCFD
jgi:hypothetical protein